MKCEAPIRWAFWALIAGALLAAIISFLWLFVRGPALWYENGYVKACEDFTDGHLKYELVRKRGGATEWTRMK